MWIFTSRKNAIHLGVLGVLYKKHTKIRPTTSTNDADSSENDDASVTEDEATTVDEEEDISIRFQVATTLSWLMICSR